MSYLKQVESKIPSGYAFINPDFKPPPQPTTEQLLKKYPKYNLSTENLQTLLLYIAQEITRINKRNCDMEEATTTLKKGHNKCVYGLVNALEKLQEHLQIPLLDQNPDDIPSII
jgi:hypothetical protein